MIGTEKEMLEEKIQILELQCDAAKERVKTLSEENAELKAENEKLKDCRNCDHLENNFCKQRKIFISNSIAQGCKYWKVYK